MRLLLNSSVLFAMLVTGSLAFAQTTPADIQSCENVRPQLQNKLFADYSGEMTRLLKLVLIQKYHEMKIKIQESQIDVHLPIIDILTTSTDETEVNINIKAVVNADVDTITAMITQHLVFTYTAERSVAVNKLGREKGGKLVCATEQQISDDARIINADTTHEIDSVYTDVQEAVIELP